MIKKMMLLTAACLTALALTACASDQDADKNTNQETPPAAQTPNADLNVPSGNNSDDAENPDSGRQTGKSKTFRIATDTTFSPFEFEDVDGNFTGIDVELLHAISEDQGFTFELQSLGFDAAVTALESGQADGVIAGMSITPDRQAKFDFSDPYFNSGIVMAVAKDSSVDSYEKLQGRTVAVKNGTEGAAFAESIADTYGFTITVFDDSSSMYQDVLSGSSAACFEDYPVIGYAISQGMKIQMVGEKQAGNSYGFAVKKGQNEELLNYFNEGLRNLKENGIYQEILDRYIVE